MADAHAGHVGDRVQRARLEVAEPEAEVAEPDHSRVVNHPGEPNAVGSAPRWPCRSRSCGRTRTGCTSRTPRSGSGCGRRPSRSPERAEPDPSRADGGRRAGRRGGSRTTTRRSSPSTTLRCSSSSRPPGRSGSAAGLPVDPGQDRVVPYIFPHPGLTAGLEPAVPAATWARTGAFCFDTMTLIGPGTWEAVRGAADAALTAADLVAGGAAAAYACCRPPGHHVTRSAYGGSCYLNNAAIAAARLRDRGRGAGRDRRRRRPPRQRGAVDLLGARRRLHRLGPRRSRSRLVPALPRRRGRARGGRGSRRRTAICRCRPGPATASGRRPSPSWCRRRAATASRRSYSRSASTPPAPTRRARSTSRAEGYREAGRIVGSTALPVVVVQEGGYDLASIGGLVLATLEGLEEGQKEGVRA